MDVYKINILASFLSYRVSRFQVHNFSLLFGQLIILRKKKHYAHKVYIKLLAEQLIFYSLPQKQDFLSTRSRQNHKLPSTSKKVVLAQEQETLISGTFQRIEQKGSVQTKTFWSAFLTITTWLKLS